MLKIVLRIALLIILLLAFALQLHAMGRQDVWGDEAFSIWLSQQPFSEIVKGGTDTHPPGYPLLLAIWIRLAGTSSFVTRALSTFLALSTVALIFALGQRIYRPSTGVVGALLGAVSPMLVYYAQETRMYTLVTAVSAASFYWALHLLHGESSARKRIYYFASTLIAVYTHYYAFFVVFAENLVAFIAWLRKDEQRPHLSWLGLQAILGLAYVPWIVVQSQFLSGKASARVSEWSLTIAREIIGQIVQHFSAGLAVAEGKAYSIALIFGVTVAVGVISSLKSHRSASLAPLFYLLVPTAFAWLVNPIMPFFYSRYLLLILPAFYLLAAEGLGYLQRHHILVMGLGLAALLIGSGYGLHGYYTDERFVKGRYGQMMAYVTQHARPNDVLLLANPLQRRLFEYYRPVDIEAHFVSEVTLSDVATEHARIWLVRFGNPAEYDPHGELNRWFSTHGSKAHSSGWTDAELTLYIMQSAADEGPQHPLHLRLGEHIVLEGYSLGAETLTPGDTLVLTLFWRARAPVEQRYTVFTHLIGPYGEIQAQRDNEPQGGSLPTDQWPIDERISDNYAILLPADAPTDNYVLNVGMYHLASGERLATFTAEGKQREQDYITLQTLEVRYP